MKRDLGEPLQPPALTSRERLMAWLEIVAGGAVAFAGASILLGTAIVVLRMEGVGLGWTLPVGLWDLLLIGAGQLLLIAAVGIVAAAVANRVRDPTSKLRTSIAATLLVTGGILDAIWRASGGSRPRELAGAIVGLAALVALAIAVATTPNAVRTWLRRHGRVLGLGAGACATAGVAWLLLVEEQRLAAALTAALCAVLGTIVVVAHVPPAKGGAPLRRLAAAAGEIVRTVLLPLGVVLLAGVVGLVLKSELGAGAVLLAAALMAAVALLTRRSHPVAYPLGVFAAVLAFGAYLAVADVWRDPDVQAVAARLQDGRELAGFLVTSSDDAISVGTVRYCRRDGKLVLRPGRAHHGTGHVDVIRRDQVGAWRVARASELSDAMLQSAVLLNDLRLDAGLAPLSRKPACADEGTIDGKERTSERVDPARARNLARAFRPIVRFDDRERWRPLNVDRLLAERRDGQPIHRLCPPVPPSLECPAVTGGDQLAVAPKSAFIDLDGDELRGARHRSPALASCPAPQPADLLDCDGGPASAIYYSAVAANGRVYIDYWWLLRYNDFPKLSLGDLCHSGVVRVINDEVCSIHEGDWEGVTAVTAVGDPERLEYVDFAQHKGVVRYRLDELEHQGQRAVVNVAEGSHAAYAGTCPPRCGQIGSPFPDGNRSGHRPWARNDDGACFTGATCLRRLPEASWNAFAGQWGSTVCQWRGVSCVLVTPPSSPRQQDRFKLPWCFKLEADARLKCDPAES